MSLCNLLGLSQSQIGLYSYEKIHQQPLYTLPKLSLSYPKLLKHADHRPSFSNLLLASAKLSSQFDVEKAIILQRVAKEHKPNPQYVKAFFPILNFSERVTWTSLFVSEWVTTCKISQVLVYRILCICKHHLCKNKHRIDSCFKTTITTRLPDH